MAEGWVVPCKLTDKPQTIVLKTGGKYVDTDIALSLPGFPDEVIISDTAPSVTEYENAKIWIQP